MAARMATPAGLRGGSGWTGAELYAAAQAAAQGAGIAALTSLQQENAQLRAKVALLQGSLRQAMEELRALREESRMPSVKVQKADASHPTTPELAFVAPPPGLPLPASLPGTPFRGHRPAGPPGLLDIPPAAQHDDSALSVTPTYPSPALTPSSSAGGLSDEGRDMPLRVVPAPGAMGAAGTLVEWRVECLHVKLKANCGFPLLSPMFSLGSLSGLRLMFIPGAAWAARQAKAGRKQQSRRRAAGTEGPAHGALKLKALSPGDAAPLRFFLVVGGRRQGPCFCDFSEHAIQGCDLEWDWAEQMDREADCLQLRLEFV